MLILFIIQVAFLGGIAHPQPPPLEVLEYMYMQIVQIFPNLCIFCLNLVSKKFVTFLYFGQSFLGEGGGKGERKGGKVKPPWEKSHRVPGKHFSAFVTFLGVEFFCVGNIPSSEMCPPPYQTLLCLR